jgi:hypothetical protein
MGTRERGPAHDYASTALFSTRTLTVKFIPRQIATPDVSFSKTENLFNLVMNPQQWRNIKQPFDSTPFADKFKIDMEQALFADVVPWIALALIEY